MGIDDEKDEKDENKNKPYDEISELLKKHYKPSKEVNSEEFCDKVSRKIDSLFHKEIMSEKFINEEGKKLSEEERYWLGLEEYLSNQLPSLKHKLVTDHLLNCKECRQNYTNLLDKKKVIFDENIRLTNLRCLQYF